MSVPSPFISQPVKILAEWCNAHGDLRNAFYGVVFDRCADSAFELVGLAPTYVKERGLSFFTAESHVCFIRPVRAGDEVVVMFQILDHDERKLRSYQEMHHVEGWLAATSEILSLHVDLSGPRVTPFPEDIRTRVDEMAAAHAVLATPARAGKRIDMLDGAQ
ncbi:thioesterase family protein [Mesorhizobium muleiense]|uniref:thioesterase family protein n=1 Tax=Mesorhizobium muleiense TaxID=1004279 RepID=UPI001F1E0B26|nr:thioesterase family protein [Mesorhizobium muleiense]MCF6110408.1 thioesterase family protein [Mesorhizobium muleiense]